MQNTKMVSYSIRRNRTWIGMNIGNKVDNQCPKKELCTMSETCHHYSLGFEPCKWDYYLNRKNELFKSKGETK